LDGRYVPDLPDLNKNPEICSIKDFCFISEHNQSITVLFYCHRVTDFEAITYSSTKRRKINYAVPIKPKINTKDPNCFCNEVYVCGFCKYNKALL